MDLLCVLMPLFASGSPSLTNPTFQSKSLSRAQRAPLLISIHDTSGRPICTTNMVTSPMTRYCHKENRIVAICRFTHSSTACKIDIELHKCRIPESVLKPDERMFS